MTAPPIPAHFRPDDRVRYRGEPATVLRTEIEINRATTWVSYLIELDRPATAPAAPGPAAYSPMSLDEIEKLHILRTLEHTDWNKSQAAAILNIERSTLDRKINRFELKQ